MKIDALVKIVKILDLCNKPDRYRFIELLLRKDENFGDVKWGNNFGKKIIRGAGER